MSWLSMLLGDKPADDYEREFQRQVARTPLEDRAELEAEARRALTLRAQIRSLRSRGNELRVLNDLAGHLVRAGESGEILRVVAQQARLLINVELAYIVLPKDSQLLVEVQDGTVGPFLKGQRVFRGGPAGQAIATGSPIQYENFTDDPASQNFSVEEVDVDPAHPARVFDAAREEEFRGVLAVPIAAEQETLGALCVVSRRPRVFTIDEIAVMTALAAHAAVALRNATMLDSYRKQADELRATNERLTRLDTELKSAIEVHDQLMDIIRAGGGVTEVLDGLGDALDSEVTFLRSTPEDVESRLRTTTDYDGSSWTVHHIVLSGDMPLGTLVLTSLHEPTDVLRRSLERGGLAMALALVTERTIAEASRREENELISSLLSGRSRDSTAVRQAQLMGLDLSTITTLCVVDFNPPRPDDAKSILRDVAQRVGGISGEQGGVGVVLCPAAHSAALRAALTTLHTRLPLCAVIEEEATSLETLHQDYLDGVNAISLLNALKSTGVRSLFELAPYARIFGDAKPGEIVAFMRARIGMLIDYDARNRSMLVFTAAVYLDQGRHKQNTANALNIHINTLKQRLERIEMLLGPQWIGPERLLETHIAVRLHMLAYERSD